MASSYSRSSKYEVLEIPVGAIFVDESFNCRLPFTEQAVEELAAQIADKGLAYPLSVQPRADVLNMPVRYDFRLIAGFRRFRSVTKILRWAMVPCFIVKGKSEIEARCYNFDENIQRKDLTLLEQAMGLRAIFPKGTELSKMAEVMKRSKGWIRSRVNLLEMPLRVQQDADAGKITQYDVDKLSRLPPGDILKALDALYATKELYEKPGRRVSLRTLSPKKHRAKREIEAMAVEAAKRYGEDFPGCFYMAWAAGNISDGELLQALDSLDV